jgi:MoaA/NifB/PqqE/SkfB family radical SAM enzyme
MSTLLNTLRSQWLNIKLFRPFFSPGRLIADGLRFPFQYLGDGQARSYPLVVDINITNRCNMACSFCYNADNKTCLEDELNIDQLCALVDEAAGHQAGFFLSGGEPLLRPDLLDLVKHIKSHKLPVGLVTNGSLLTAEMADLMASAGLDVAVLSLHGLRRGHNRASGQPGSFNAVWQALELLRTRLSPPGPLVNIVVGPHSLEDLPDLLTALQQLDNVVPRLAHLSFLTAAETSKHHAAWSKCFQHDSYALLNQELTFDSDHFEHLCRLLSRPEIRRVPARPSLSPREIRHWYNPDFGVQRRCLFIWQSTVINADGTVFPCQYHAWPMGNIREQSLSEIWNNDRYRHFRRVLRKGLLPGCARCCKL